MVSSFLSGCFHACIFGQERINYTLLSKGVDIKRSHIVESEILISYLIAQHVYMLY